MVSALAVLVLIVSCGSTEEVTVVGRVHYYYPRDSAVCEGDAEYLNSSLEHLERYLGLQPFDRVGYHYKPDGIAADCLDEVAGCARTQRGVAYGIFPAVAHELVHLVADDREARMPFLREGIAEALDDDESWMTGEEANVGGTDPPYEALMAAPPKYYEALASYVSTWVRRWGLEQLQESYRQLPTDANLEVFEEALHRRGSSLDEFNALRKEDVASAEFGGIPLLRCSVPLAQETPDGWSIEANVGCGEEGHRRGLSTEFVYRRRVVLAESAGLRVVSAQFEDEARLSLRSCDQAYGGYGMHDGIGPGQVVAVQILPAGTYTLSAFVPEARAPQTIAVSVTNLDAGAFLLPGDERTTLFLKTPGGKPLIFPFILSVSQHIGMARSPSGSDTVVELCSTSACATLHDQELKFAVEPGAYELRIVGSQEETVRVALDWVE